MQAREVSVFNHTTVEYLDRSSGRWQWLDPLNKIEITDATGRPLSWFKIRQTSSFQSLTYKKLGTAIASFDAKEYGGYALAQMGTMLWRRGTNFLEVEAWDRRLAGWYLSKSMRQAVMLVTGIQPHYLMVTTHADTFYYKALRALLWAAGGGWIIFNVFVLAWLVRHKPLRLTYSANTD